MNFRNPGVPPPYKSKRDLKKAAPASERCIRLRAGGHRTKIAKIDDRHGRDQPTRYSSHHGRQSSLCPGEVENTRSRPGRDRRSASVIWKDLIREANL